jgi:hypothetical protein
MNKNNNKKYVRYLTSNHKGFGWGRTPLEAWINNPHTNIEYSDCETYEISSFIEPIGKHCPSNWEVYPNQRLIYTDNENVSVRKLWFDFLDSEQVEGADKTNSESL